MPDALVTRFIDAVVANDLDTAASLVSDDVEYDNVPMGAVHGRDALKATLGPFLDEASAIEWIVHHQVASGDLAGAHRGGRENAAVAGREGRRRRGRLLRPRHVPGPAPLIHGFRPGEP